MSTENTAPSAAPQTTSPETSNEAAESQTNDTTAEATSDAQSSEVSGNLSEDKSKSKTPTPEEKKSNKKTLKLKVDGQDFDEEIDLDNEEELIRHLQLSKVAQKRMSEKATYEKQVNAFFQMLQTNPEKALREVGLDPEKFSVELLQKKIEDEQKSPEQRELEQIKRELEEHRAQSKAEKEAKQIADREQMNLQQERQIEEGMISALEKTQLPNEPLVVRRIAEIMLTAVENNLDIQPLQAAEIAKKELELDMKQYLSILPDEALEALVGKDRIGNFRKKQVAAIKKAGETANSVKQTGNSVINKEEKAAPKKSIKMSSFLSGR